MGQTQKKGNFLVLGVRNLIFYGLWIGPLLFLCGWHWKFFSPAQNLLQQNPWKYFFAAVIWFFLAWLSIFLMNLIWPVLLLIFFKTERLRNPKVIIQIGDRFRKMGLPSPQIFILTDSHQVWKNKVLGFFALPSPFGSLLLVGPEISESLDSEQFDTWICHQVIESKFYKYSRRGFLIFLLIPFSLFLGLFSGSILFGFESPIAYLFSVFIAIVCGVFIFQISKQRIFDIDFRSIRSFHLNPELYFQIESFSHPHRQITFAQTSEKYDAEISIPSFRPQLISYLFIFLISTLAIGLGFFVDQKYSKEFSLQTLFDSIDQSQKQIHVVKLNTPPERALAVTPIAEPTQAVGITPAPISKAVLDGDIRQVVRVLGTGIRLDFKDTQLGGATPLLLAIKNGDLEMVYVLLAIGAKFSDTDDLGRNALFYALEAPNPTHVIRYALSGKADPLLKAIDGKTALDQAKEQKMIEAASLLEASIQTP